MLNKLSKKQLILAVFVIIVMMFAIGIYHYTDYHQRISLNQFEVE